MSPLVSEGNLMNIENWISKAKTAKNGKKYAVAHHHVEFFRKPDGIPNDVAAECTEKVVADTYKVYVLCENYSRGKMVKTWRMVKSYQNKSDAINHWENIK